MSKNLVIVESPAKAKTIEKFLGKDFKVVSSNGHISDLPSSELGINVDENYEPKYIISKDKKDLVKKLKSEVKNVDTVWLASDEDREGEAIAWHLQESLNLDEEKTKRIVFREITEEAIKKAITNPRKIDKSLVDAQQARRILDRLVGYKISPILWRKVKGGLSAGRVQSVALRLISEREKEIDKFDPAESYRILGLFKTLNGKIFKAKYLKNIKRDNFFESFLNGFLSSSFSVESVIKTPTEKKPTPPFTTSTLQQEASRKLGFSVSRTMSAAQKLYEQGHITYMRTDSVNLSNQAVKSIKETVLEKFGENYFFERIFKNKSKSAQQAHEAVRPTVFSNENLILDSDQTNLYKLIWKRTVSSQMANAKLDKTVIKIKSSNHKDFFQADGEVVMFDGFLKLYIESKDNVVEKDNDDLLPKLEIGDKIEKNQISITQVFSKPPFRFSEATLVKKLEELGIGRPSTYAPTISTIMNRKYVFKGDAAGVKRELIQFLITNQIDQSIISENFGSNKGKLVPSEVGLLVNEFLTNNFGNIIDYNFTASVEDDFDSIATGKKEWQSIIDNFYNPFNLKVDDVSKNAKRETGERILGEDPKTGRQLSVKLGKFGPIAQIGKNEDEEKPVFASLLPDQQISKITFDQALKLFNLPIYLGDYLDEKVEANIGRYGPYVKFGKKFISISDGTSPFEITYDNAIELIKKKNESEKPIITYKGYGATKGKGRFGPFIKWNNMFINVNKKYDFDNLSDSDFIDLIEEKIKKEKEKIIKNWVEDKITIEKGRWGKIFIIKGKKKVQIPKAVDPKSIDLEQAKKFLKK
jgi:DNA topoisomerase-1|tara:strand:+ start:3825 stop:6263 length:2439 start_codon:yes stop_codon:yes gene_type:complete